MDKGKYVNQIQLMPEPVHADRVYGKPSMALKFKGLKPDDTSLGFGGKFSPTRTLDKEF
jgi:hypothetical protein